jgi:hypothetical protein
MAARFAELSENELSCLLEEKKRGKHKKATKTAVNVFRLYTNHSIRATIISILDECGYEARHIMAVSDHRSENSIRSYAAKTSLSKKRKMSEALSSTISDEKQNHRVIRY